MKNIVTNASETFNVSKKDAKAMVDFVISQIVDTIVTEKKAKITGLGTFYLNNKPARKGRNPKTGATVDVDAKNVIKFKTTKELQELING